MDVEATVEAYYDALRAGDPLHPFFADRPTTVKFGIGERLTGYEEIAEGLRDQTATTRDWTVDSKRLVVEQREGYGWFSDDVHMAWTDERRDREYAFDTRWSGTLERRDEPEEGGPPWRFVGMHVSTEGDTA